MYVQIGTTIILRHSDLIDEFKKNKRHTVIDFKVSLSAINAADNIIYIDPEDNVIFFKRKRNN